MIHPPISTAPAEGFRPATTVVGLMERAALAYGIVGGAAIIFMLILAGLGVKIC